MAEPFTIYKLIVLYMAQHSKKALTNSQISEFVLDREYTDYFQLQKVLSELTDEGSNTLSYFENNLSQEIKKEIEEYLKNCGYEKKNRILTPADYYTTPQGGYAVRCQIIEKDSTVLDLNLIAPGKEAAQAICRNWAHKSQDIYSTLMAELI